MKYKDHSQRVLHAADFEPMIWKSSYFVELNEPHEQTFLRRLSQIYQRPFLRGVHSLLKTTEPW